MLTTKDLCQYYGHAIALRNLNLEIEKGEAVAILGSNGAGKTSLLDTIAGLNRNVKGMISFLGEDITRKSVHERAKLGIGYCPASRRLAPTFRVVEHVELGGMFIQSKERCRKSMSKVMKLFPVLAERRTQLAGTLSGGEQQMLNIGRALMAEPKLLMLDEPSQGLSPLLKKKVYEKLKELSCAGETSILLTEQDAFIALNLCSRVYLLENGTIVFEGSREEVKESNIFLRKAYLGM